MYVPSYYNTPLGDTNSIHVKVWISHREFFVNGHRLTAGRNYPFNPAGDFMLWSPGPRESTPVVRYSKLRVRQIAYLAPPLRQEDETLSQYQDRRVQYFAERIEGEPKNLWHYLDRGHAYYSSGHYNEAISDYEHLLERRPKWDFALMRAGMAHAGLGEYQKAIDRYQQVLKLVPGATHVLNHWAWLEATCKDPRFRNADKALEHVRQAIKLSKSRERDYFLTLAAAHAEKGDFTAARKALKRAGPLAGKPEKALLAPMKEAFDAGKPFRDNSTTRKTDIPK